MGKAFLVFLVAFILSLRCLANPMDEINSNREAQKHYSHLSKSQRVTMWQIRKEIKEGGIPAAARRAQMSLDSIFLVAQVNLEAKGYRNQAYYIKYQWRTFYRAELMRVAMASQFGDDIGDHSPLWQWLADVYDKVEKALGVEVCKALHLSDIKTMNYGLPIVFRACTFPMDNVTIGREHEYRNHFAKGSVYYGVVPVATWWAISIGCWSGTSGVGSFLCALAATGAEWLMGNVIAPHLSDQIFEAVCHQ